MTSRFECPRCQTVFTPDKGDDDAYVECPACGAMAMSVGEATDALARNLSSTHDAGVLHDRTTESPADDEDEDSGLVNRDPSLVHNFASAGIFSGLLDAPTKDASPPPVAGGLDLGLEFGLDAELGDFELPATAPGNAALSPAKKTPAKKTAPSPSSAASPPPPKRPTPSEQPVDVGASFGDDALDALGAAFDSMAQRPSLVRGPDGLSDDERNFLSAEAPPPQEAKAPPRRPPPRPPGKPGERRQPPPSRAKKRDRAASTGISLSAEAKAAAFLPLKASSSSSSPMKQVDTDIGPRAKRQAVAAEAGEATMPAGTSPAESTQLLSRPKQGPAPREKPSVLGGVPVWAMAAAVLIGLLGGGAAGALTAPGAVKRNDARGHAEEKLVEGNRFYADGRYEDAIASYKAALNYDRAFAVAHRAKGAALARKDRYDEAAVAYRDYLALEPSAIDAGDIKEALGRRGVAPVAGGEGVR